MRECLLRGGVLSVPVFVLTTAGRFFFYSFLACGFVCLALRSVCMGLQTAE